MRENLPTFKKLFNDYLKRSGYNTSTLSKAMNFNRTTLVKYSTGGSIPDKIDTIHKLSVFFCLTNKEKKELISIYDKEKGGTKHLIKLEMLELISNISKPFNSQTISLCQTNFSFSATATYPAVLNNNYQIVSFILHIINQVHEENTEIKMFLPFNFSLLFENVKILFSESNPPAKIKHIIQLDNSENKLSSNLSSISQLLLFTFSLNSKYESRYLFDNSNIIDNTPVILPYYVISKDYLITISNDFNSAVIYNNVDLISFYTTRFDNLFQEAHEPLMEISNPNDLTSFYYKNINNRKLETKPISVYTIESVPCILKLINMETAKSKLSSFSKSSEIFIKYIESNFETNRTVNFTSYFTQSGLNRFLRTGRLSIYPDVFYQKFSLKERVAVLESLKDNLINEDDPSFIMLNDLHLDIGYNLSITSSENMDSIITYKSNENFYLSSISLPFVNQELLAFTKNLLNSKYIYPTCETLKIIQDNISALNKQIMSSSSDFTTV